MNWLRKRDPIALPPDTRTVNVVDRLELVADKMELLANEIELAIVAREAKRAGRTD